MQVRERMAISSERFAQGMTVDQYKEQMTRNREQFAENERRVALRPEDRAFFAQLRQPLNIAVITEDWCGDALANVPVLARVAQETGKLNLRLFLRDQNLDLIDQYLKEGKYRSIPVFVILDEQMNDLGHFIERPARATAEMAALRTRLAVEHPELPDLSGPSDDMSEQARTLYFDALKALRAERRDAWNAMLLDDIRTLLAVAVTR
jgi:hypothetical protein